MADEVREAVRAELEARHVSENDLRLALRAELAELELRLMDKLVTRAEHAELVKKHDALAVTVAQMAIHGSARAQDDHLEIQDIRDQIEVNVNWRNRMAGAIAVLAGFATVAAPAIFQHYF